MPNYRRSHISGGAFFFTVVTYARRPLFQDVENQTLLGEAIRECKKGWPFDINAMVLLPDHLHAIWTLPHGDANYSGRWSVIKKEFTTRFVKAGGRALTVTKAQENEGRRGVWQPRFWEHTLEDVDDYEAHFDYIHYNPVKHGYVRRPRDWGPSSFHRWVDQGVYSREWACGDYCVRDFSRIEDNCGEPD